VVGSGLSGPLPADRSTTGASIRSRVEWVDAAKAIAIFMVALAHSVQWTVPTGLAPEWWDRVNLLFIVFRMPLFFLASGLFAASVIARGWRELWRSRLSLLVWALLLWTVVRYLFFLAVPNPTGMDETDPVDLLLAPVRPSNGLWFLYALALFFVVLKLLRGRVDQRLQLAAAAVLSAWFFARADTGNIAWNGIGRYLVFFMIGCFLRDRIVRFVERRGIGTGVLLGAAFGATAVVILALQYRVPFLTSLLLGVSLLAVGAGLLVARFLLRFRWMRWLPVVGRHTLPVYVLHVLVVSALTSLLLIADGQRWLALAGPAVPVIVAAAAVGISLGIWRLTRDLPVLRYGYEAPDWFRGRPVPSSPHRRTADDAPPVRHD